MVIEQRGKAKDSVANNCDLIREEESSQGAVMKSDLGLWLKCQGK